MPGTELATIQTMVGGADLLVNHNIKFDLHWLHKVGIDLTGKRVYDTMLAEFLMSNQVNRLPSLDSCCEKYGLPRKLTVIEDEYWSKGINTDEIPKDVLYEYAKNDVDITYQLYLTLLKEVPDSKRRLLSLMNQDLLVLQEMERNGLLYRGDLCEEKAKEIDLEIATIESKLKQIHPDIPINFASNDDLSVFLYGGVIKETIKVPDGVFKTGPRAGQIKLKNEIREHNIQRKYQPIKALKKEGYYATNEDSLRKLRGNRTIVELLLKLAYLSKLNSTYYKGLPNKNRELRWERNVLHGNYNQCIARTGRLSSSEPNLQNLSKDSLDIIVSRYID